MRLIILSIILATSFSVQAEDLVVLGRLKTIEEGVPHCGVLCVGAVAEYEVLKVIAGNYPGKGIFVVHPCIEMQRPKLVLGNIYKLVLARENIHRIEVFQEKKIPKRYTTYFLKTVEPRINDEPSHNKTLKPTP